MSVPQRIPDPALSAAPAALLCISTAPDRATAERIARTLVDERLVACVNLLPGVTSVYRWQGEVETGEEVLMLAKTTGAGLAALTARIAALHPYDVPEVISLDITGGLPAYLEWIAAETAGGAGA
jgi:periplasmic divalent cation tolerance protein